MDGAARKRRHRHLDADALAKFANLQLRVKAVVDGAMAGLHRSPHHGSSIEFAEHKEYSPGDDVRRLDWKAYAKFDRYFIRQYEDETELKGYVLLDCSGSMGYGAPLSKLEFGSVLAASLAYLLARQRDQPSLITFAEGVQTFLPPRPRSDHIADLLAALEAQRAEGGTDLEKTIKQVIDRMGRRSLVVLISDLFDVRPETLRLLRNLRARHHQVVVLHLLHDDELTLPFSELTTFEAIERRADVLVDPASIRRAYLAEMGRFIRETEAICKEGEVGYSQVSTAQPLDDILSGMLQQGRRR